MNNVRYTWIPKVANFRSNLYADKDFPKFTGSQFWISQDWTIWLCQKILAIGNFCKFFAFFVLKFRSFFRITCSHKLISKIIPNFHKTTREISFHVTKDSFSVQNHIDNPDIDKETIRSNSSLRIDEFETFSVKEDGVVAFSYADFRSMCHFAEASEAFVRMFFDKSGDPFCMSCNDQNAFDAILVMATMLHDMEDTGRDELRNMSLSDRTSQTSDNVNVQKSKTNTERRKKRMIRTQNDDNPFAFININPENDPEPVRHRISKVSRPPSVIPESEPASSTGGSHVSDTRQPALLRRKPSSIIPCPPLIETPVHNQQSEEIIFETEESESRTDTDQDVVMIGDDMLEITPPSSQFMRRRNYLLENLFNKTFDPRSVPGADEILVPASDDEG